MKRLILVDWPDEGIPSTARVVREAQLALGGNSGRLPLQKLLRALADPDNEDGIEIGEGEDDLVGDLASKLEDADCEITIEDVAEGAESAFQDAEGESWADPSPDVIEALRVARVALVLMSHTQGSPARALIAAAQLGVADDADLYARVQRLLLATFGG